MKEQIYKQLKLKIMKKQIEHYLKEVGEHFKSKLLAGEFEFVSCGKHTAKIKIDGYPFELWIANAPEHDLEIYTREDKSNSIFKDEFKFTTQNQRITVWNYIKPFVDNYRKNTLIKEKRAELKQLEQQLKES